MNRGHSFTPTQTFPQIMLRLCLGLEFLLCTNLQLSDPTLAAVSAADTSAAASQRPFLRSFAKVISQAVAAPDSAPCSLTHFLEHSCGLSSVGAVAAAKGMKLPTNENARLILDLLKKHPFLLLPILKNTLEPNLEILRSILRDNDDVNYVVKDCVDLLQLDLRRMLPPRFDALRRLGATQHVLFTLAKIHHCVLVLSDEVRSSIDIPQVGHCVEK